MTTAAAVDRWGYWILAACLGIAQFNLLTAQVLFGIAALLWLQIAITERRFGPVPGYFWWLAAYAGLTLASAGVSADPRAGLIDSKQLVLFLMIPMVARLLRGDRAMRALDVVIAIGAVGAMVGVVQYSMLDYDNLSQRPMGSLSHYMTYSGVTMLVLCAAVARLLFYPDQRIWPGIAVPALVVALTVTQTRNAWIGALAGIVCLTTIRRPKLLVAVPVLLLVGWFVAPAAIKARALSSFDPADPSNKDRIQMLGMGVRMVKDHPLFGVGPNMVKVVYPEYRPADYVHPTNPHLHNVPMQIAAERGLPALVLWCGFIVTAFVSLMRQVRSGPARALAGAGLAAIVSMLVAGLFEYNFGDSEFMMLFLGLITLPFAAARAAARGPDRV